MRGNRNLNGSDRETYPYNQMVNKKYGYVRIMLNDTLGGGLDYQLGILKHSAKRIGLTAEFIEMDLKEIKKN